ncbi:uncharacterized protein MELLADRAFT_69622 [Melampsora larici-populina 98AG31]|uniref:Uncharacterized protein n=1 Tax=Melampsora larici-populina (strain 98AG31 / pathotype 3-4-7) TaxID=747676 RepID=F4SBE5_MELLP|nr:uncharacterized protein MELLADRAFT_69622 [Melampsora larici-populina 98AG31]EGF98015.1 hypothetical protein MELLADRAFT_69622 [Melampsora larici-populina 98AG31]
MAEFDLTPEDLELLDSIEKRVNFIPSPVVSQEKSELTSQGPSDVEDQVLSTQPVGSSFSTNVSLSPHGGNESSVIIEQPVEQGCSHKVMPMNHEALSNASATASSSVIGIATKPTFIDDNHKLECVIVDEDILGYYHEPQSHGYANIM